MWQNVNNQNNQSETFGAETFLQPFSNSQQPPGTPAASQEMHIFWWLYHISNMANNFWTFA